MMYYDILSYVILYYKALGVATDALNCRAGLKKAYRQAALRWHPDKNPGIIW